MKLSWKERLAQIGHTEDANCMAGETVTCFFQGVGLIAGSQYPDWLLQRLRETYGMPVNYPYDLLVSYAVDQSLHEETEREGQELLHHLLIEPFYLITEEEPT